jgi:hypothetical protein
MRVTKASEGTNAHVRTIFDPEIVLFNNFIKVAFVALLYSIKMNLDKIISFKILMLVKDIQGMNELMRDNTLFSTHGRGERDEWLEHSPDCGHTPVPVEYFDGHVGDEPFDQSDVCGVFEDRCDGHDERTKQRDAFCA